VSFLDLPNLVTVNLEDSQISDEGVMLWTAEHSQPDSLQNINLNRTAVTHEVLRLLKSEFIDFWMQPYHLVTRIPA
jgi:hypothetical protein